MEEKNDPDINDAQDEQHDPADVLANMAADSPTEIPTPPEDDDADEGDHLDALTRMADEEPPAVADEGFTPEPPPVEESEEYDAEIAEATGLAGEDAFAARRARAATIGSHSAAANQHTFKRTALPLLVVMGVLLILVGLASAGVLVANQGKGSRDTELTVLMIACFPLSAVMFFGAWWFHRDIKAGR